MEIERTRIQIKGDAENPQRAEVFINGQKIHGVHRISYEHKACCIPNVELDLSGVSMEQIRTIVDIEETANITVRTW